MLLHVSRVDSRGDVLLFWYRPLKKDFLPEERKKVTALSMPLQYEKEKMN